VLENGQPRTRSFGLFEVDLLAGELRRNGLKIKLQEQPFQILSLLLEKPGEIVSRDDLRKRLWPADTFVDFDHSLNAAIKRLRDALGDTAENPRFVETVARRGYRFVAPVNGAGTNGNAMTEVAAAVPQSIAPSKRHSWLRWVAGVGLAAVLVLLGLKLGSFLEKQPASAPRFLRLTANPADDRVRVSAISPNGKYLAFADETGFYLREIDSGETHSIATPSGSRIGSAGWFPDSAHLVMGLMGTGEESGLWAVSVLGGSPRRLSDEGRSAAVSLDGTRIAFLKGSKMHEEIWLVAADGGQPRKLVGEEGDFFGSLVWSPDSTKIAYTRGHYFYAWGVKAGIEIFDLGTQHIQSVMSSETLDGPVAWVAPNRLVYTLVEPPPRRTDSNLWWVSLDDQGRMAGHPVRLTSDTGVVQSITASADGKRLTFLKGVPQPDVYVARLNGQNISEPQRLTLDDRQDFPFEWTPDGKSVIFISDRTGTFNVYKQDIDRTVPELLISGTEAISIPRLSPDGSQLLYLVYPRWGNGDAVVPVMRVPLAGGTPQKLLEGRFISNHQCARSPGTGCVYSIIGEKELTFFQFDPFQGQGAQIFQIKDDFPTVYNWSLSPDGTTLAIGKGKWGGTETPRIQLVSIPDRTEKWLELRDVAGVASLDWAADSKSLWAAEAGEEGNALVNIDRQGRVRTVWRPKKMTMGWAIPSRDGRYLALKVGSGSANAWMLENF
jgi:DNA-binding winged helix-turn-helix (wHTH) protein/Tol biopolymer transport system component